MSKKYQTSTLSKILAFYRLIEKYQAKNKVFPAMRDLVNVGFCDSLNTVRYYFEAMEDMNMLEYERVIARSSRLLPLSGADTRIRELIGKET